MTNKAIYDFDYNGNHIDTGKWPSSKLAVSPRLGFTWDVFGDKSLKVRGGTGLFSGRLPLVFFTNMPTNSNMVQYKGIWNATGSNSAARGRSGWFCYQCREPRLQDAAGMEDLCSCRLSNSCIIPIHRYC